MLSTERSDPKRLFHRETRTDGTGAGGLRDVASLGHKPRPSGSRRQTATHQSSEQIRLWAGGGEGDADPGGGLGDTGADLDQMQPQGGELGRGERLRAGDGVTNAQQQPIGSRVQDQTHLVGERLTATGAVGGKLALVQLIDPAAIILNEGLTPPRPRI